MGGNPIVRAIKGVQRVKHNMYCLVIKWDYEYEKEGTWFDNDSGEDRYAFLEGASYPLPHIKEKSLEIRSVTYDSDTVKAELYVDCHTVTVSNVGDPVTVHASNSYSVCGDCVHQSLSLKIVIEKQ